MNNGVYKSKNFQGGMESAGAFAQMSGGVEQSLIGAYGFIRAEQQRKKYEKLAVPEYGEDPSMKTSRLRAEAATKYGFSPQQRASFFQTLAQANNTAYNRGINYAGGNNSQAINTAIQGMNIKALNNFAGQDAQLNQENIKYADAFSRNLQLIKNMNTQKDYAQYIQTGAAISQARNDSLKNLVGGAQTFAGSGSTPFQGGGTGYGTGQRGASEGADAGGYLGAYPQNMIDQYGYSTEGQYGYNNGRSPEQI